MKSRLLALVSSVAIIVVGLSVAVFSRSTYAAQTELDPQLVPPPPYLEYKIYKDSVIEDTTMPPVLNNGLADYKAIFEEHDLCALISSGQVDEVWIWAGNGDGINKGHMWEWTTSGGDWNGNAPDCGKIVTTMTFNYLREVDVALESYNHRLEGFFGHYFTCDFSESVRNCV